MTRPGPHARLVGIIALTLVTSTLGACATWGSSRPDSDRSASPLRTTVVNNHGHGIMFGVSAQGTEWRLGMVQSGEHGTFSLPPSVEAGSTYYLLGDCLNGQRIVSGRIAAAAASRPQFMVGQNSLTSYVRFLRTSWTGTGTGG